MDTILTRPEAAVLILVLVVESVKALMLGTITAYQRGKLGKFINAEDANWLKGEVVTFDEPEPNRLFRAHRNSLENLLPFSLLAMAFLLVSGNSFIGIIYFVTFSISRLAHSYAYLTCKPMLRRNVYSIAWLVQIIMGIHILTIFIGSHIDGI